MYANIESSCYYPPVLLSGEAGTVDFEVSNTRFGLYSSGEFSYGQG